jgi:hypothetical protein
MWFKPAEYQNPNQLGVATIAKSATNHPENLNLSQKSRMSQVFIDSIHDFEQSDSVAIIAKVATGLSVASTEKLMTYLDAIGETNQESIDEYLTECGKDAETLARQLQQADDCLLIKTGNYAGLVQCSGCQQLSGDTCNLHGWCVVVNKWRRCDDYAKAPATSSCKSCGHFKSFYEHGGGAGACGAGVMPFGACHWADTVHECEKYQPMEAKK